MSFYEMFFLFAGGGLFGGLIMGVRARFEKKALIQRTRREGDHILQSARDKSSILLEDSKKEGTARAKRKAFEREKEISSSRLQELKAVVDKQAFRFKIKIKENKTALIDIKYKRQKNQNSKTNSPPPKGVFATRVATANPR